MTLFGHPSLVRLAMFSTLVMSQPPAACWTKDPLERLTAALMLGKTLNFLIGFSGYDR